MAEHTPTWYVEPDELDESLFKICEQEYGTIAWEVESAERAHKMAAAPELLAALMKAYDCESVGEQWPRELFDEVADLIVKARGKTGDSHD